MRRGSRYVLMMAVAIAAASGPARAQYGRFAYPGGYGNYGWGGWGADPASGLMAGLGAYAQGQGVYELLDAKAQAINTDTVMKWNKALRERRRELDYQKRQEDAARHARDAARGRQLRIESGETLNALLDRIGEFNPSGTRAYAAKAAISPGAIRDIPFEPATEAITLCLDQMTAQDAWPQALQDDKYADRRQAVAKAVDKALEQDRDSQVTPQTIRQINAAVADLRASYVKNADTLDVDYAETDDFLKSLAGLSRMLRNPRYRQIIAELETYKGTDVGDLIAFMHSFNLRFGPATSDRQKEIYAMLAPMLQQVLADTGGPANAADAPPPPPPSTGNGKALRDASREAFKGMKWKHFEANDKDANP